MDLNNKVKAPLGSITTSQTQQVCRTCMSSSNLNPLFPKAGNYRSFVRALYLTTGLQMTAYDGLTQKICKTCAKMVENAIRFRSQSQATGKILQQMAKCPKTICKQTDNNGDVMKLKSEKRKREKELIEPNIISNSDPSKPYIAIVMATKKRSILETEYETEIFDDKRYSDFDSQENSFPALTDEEETRLLAYLKTSTQQLRPYSDLIDDPQNEKEVRCKICKKTYKTMPAFEKHARTHTRRIICEFCGRHCLSNAQLLRHHRALHGLARDNSYACSYCEYQALDKEQLESHERRSHTKERPYVCDQCGEAFYTKRVLVQHINVHKAERPYECNLCSSKFRVIGRLNHHKNVVHHKKFTNIFRCYICRKMYHDSSTTRTHIYKVHGIPKEKQAEVLRINRDEEIKY